MSAHALIQTARGMCTDERPHVEIDALLGRAVDAVKDVEEALAEAERTRDAAIKTLNAIMNQQAQELRVASMVSGWMNR